jgi:hypothetical protein
MEIMCNIIYFSSKQNLGVDHNLYLIIYKRTIILIILVLIIFIRVKNIINFIFVNFKYWSILIFFVIIESPIIFFSNNNIENIINDNNTLIITLINNY